LINGLNDKNKAKISSIFVERSTQHNIGKKWKWRINKASRNFIV